MPLSGHTVIYGGSFDPPHLSHQMACLYLLEGLGAEAVWVVPVFGHPFGKMMSDFRHRFAMCQAMARALSPRVTVLDVEQRLGGPSRTHTTVSHLQTTRPDLKFALAIGADLMADTPRWYLWPAIEAMLPVVVIGRTGYPSYDSKVALPAISSTDIRRAIGEGQSIEGQVPTQVARYIAQSGLYRAGAAATDGKSNQP